VLFAACSKITIIYIIIKFILIVGNCFNNVDTILKFVGFLSIVIGSFLSLKQKRLKRFIVYSSIAQVGFIALGIGIHTFESIGSAYFFVAIYSLSSLLIWGYLITVYKNQSLINSFKKLNKKPVFISNLAEHSKFNIVSTSSLALIFFSSAGMPPFSGFLSKILIIIEVIHSKSYFFAIVILIVASIPMFYYIRVIKVNFFEPQKNKFISMQAQFMSFNILGVNKIYLTLTFSLILLVYTFFMPEFLLSYSSALIFTC
jgi:NADH-quinone oxidoreductase subunit N